MTPEHLNLYNQYTAALNAYRTDYASGMRSERLRPAYEAARQAYLTATQCPEPVDSTVSVSTIHEIVTEVPPIQEYAPISPRSGLNLSKGVFQMGDCVTQVVSEVYDKPGEARDGIRETSSVGRDVTNEVSRGNQFTAASLERGSIDRANQDRYLAAEFRGLGVQVASQEARLQKDNVDAAHWTGAQFSDVRKDICGLGSTLAKDLCDLSKDVLQSKYDLAISIEKTGAATALAIEKTAAAVALAGEKQAAATALCCCEGRAATAASTAAILAAITANTSADLARQLTVMQVRAGLPGITPS